MAKVERDASSLVRIFLLTIVLVVIGTFTFPKTAYAHDMYFVQTTVDATSYKYTAVARMDKTGITGLESGHIAYDYNFSDLLKSNFPSVSGTDYKLEEEDGGVVKTPKFTFGFPYTEQGALWGGKDKNNATKADGDQAQYVASTLPTQLNDFLDYVYEGKRPSSMDEHVKRMEEVTSAISTVSGGGSATINGYKLTQGKLKPYKNGYDKTYGTRNQDWVTVTTPDGEYQIDFIYAVPKGYKKVGSWNNSHLKRDYKYDDDAELMTWNMLVYQAHYFYFAASVSTSNTHEIGEPGYLEQKIVELLESVLNGLNGLLGLYSMEELLYNEGVRDSNSWHYGAFPKYIDGYITKFHLVFQAIAWSLLIAALYKLLIMRNLSAMNPAMRVSLKNGVLDLCITAFLLAIIFPLINFLLLVNYRLVDIFASMGLSLDNLAGLNSYNGLLSGILLQFYYFFIELWLNFTYIIRSTLLAVLTASSPLFIAAIAFGAKYKQLFGTFMKELTGNIFLQSVQAFAITFLLLTSSQSRGIELAIMMFGLIVITEFFRSLVFGQSGGMATKVGASALSSGVKGVGGMAKGYQKGKMKDKISNKDGGKSREVDADSSSNSESSGNDTINDSGGFDFNRIKNPYARNAAKAGAGALGVAGTGGAALAAGGYALAFGAIDPSAVGSAAEAVGMMGHAGKKQMSNIGSGVKGIGETMQSDPRFQSGSNSDGGALSGDDDYVAPVQNPHFNPSTITSSPNIEGGDMAMAGNKVGPNTPISSTQNVQGGKDLNLGGSGMPTIVGQKGNAVNSNIQGGNIPDFGKMPSTTATIPSDVVGLPKGTNFSSTTIADSSQAAKDATTVNVGDGMEGNTGGIPSGSTYATGGKTGDGTLVGTDVPTVDGGSTTASGPIAMAGSNKVTGGGTITDDAGKNVNMVEQAIVDRTPSKPRPNATQQYESINLDQQKMQQMGVVRMNSDAGGNLHARYNPQNLSTENRDKLDMMASAFENGTPDDKRTLRAAGVQKVGVDQKTGEYTVTYNTQGRNNLGINSARSTVNGFTQEVPTGTTPQIMGDVSGAQFSENVTAGYNQRVQSRNIASRESEQNA
ncbi:hypothetical protein ABD91_20220 [Lysinibacillus sphaericus]|uniref:hypothetical protein n=1 Tax=Lysinibacillus sphaericus TaxID=1421 RepID=UPI0018CF3E1A|nr:hypothetical protein [Lysinibacillus sphaericus]MBG9693079.1 hypothetical protein [Lysinibacillus sphaericus]